MTKQFLTEKLTFIRGKAATHGDALIRSELIAAIDEISDTLAATPAAEAPDLEWLTEDYRIARQFIVDERKMRVTVFATRRETFRRNKLAECDQAGQALNRLAAALGVETPALAARAPQMTQAPLIERGRVDGVTG